MIDKVSERAIEMSNDKLVIIQPDMIPYLNYEEADTMVTRYTDRLNNFYKNKLGMKYSPTYNYMWIFSGESELSIGSGSGSCPNFRYLEKEYEYKYDMNRSGSMARPLDTGVDLGYLRDKYPNDRWKFYLSLNSATPEQKNKSLAFLKEFLERCKQQKVSLMIKTEEHSYDQPDIFTWQPVTMAKILQELYLDKRFFGIWFDALRFFQRNIGKSVPVSHIGMVQEPFGGVPLVHNLGFSHTERTVVLGRSLDETIARMHNGGKIGTLTYMNAAKAAGVESSQPWRVDRNILKTLNQPKS